MDALLPGLVDDFKAGGAVTQVMGLTTRFEAPGYDPFPQRDAGVLWYSLSRPLLELCIRRRIQAIANISWEQNCAVERLQHDSEVVTGVSLREGRSLSADYVIDASGHGDLTLSALAEMGYTQPRATLIGIDVHYATAEFEIPEDAPSDWKVLMGFSDPAVMIVPVEGNRWICTLVWHGDRDVPRDRESFIEMARTLRTSTCYQAIKNARMLGKPTGHLFVESRHRHFSELQSYPRGVLPVADAICRFNPLYGQGMSVAALQAEALSQSLGNWQGSLHELTHTFLQQTDQIIAVPWSTSALPDLAYPSTRGVRPPNLKQLLEFGAAFLELSARDGNVHKLRLEIIGLLKPNSALTGDPVLMQRIYGIMEEMARAAEAKMSQAV
jgi:2-polyprenyl-6-methoxyphenol hydroxylase-like FAD-dependent oxidoreductase